MNNEQLTLARDKIGQQKNEEIMTLKKELKEAKLALAKPKKDAPILQEGSAIRAPKEVYAELRKERDEYAYELASALEDLEAYKQKYKDISSTIKDFPGKEDTMQEGSVRRGRSSSLSVSAANSQLPVTPPAGRRQKPYGEIVQDSPATVRGRPSTPVQSIPFRSAPHRSLSAATRYHGRGQRRVSQALTPWEQLNQGLGALKELTEEQLDQLREGLKVKEVMVAGLGYHICGPVSQTLSQSERDFSVETLTPDVVYSPQSRTPGDYHGEGERG